MDAKNDVNRIVNDEQHQQVIKLAKTLPLGSLRSIASRSKTSSMSINRFMEGKPMRKETYDKIYDTIIVIALEVKEKKQKRADQLNSLLDHEETR